ncbi:MAG TPA: hypothetical protein VG476_05215 [Acidimicrobiales bacterium]|nr:hypothetical protein [Acidimicrobiales bacterium]
MTGRAVYKSSSAEALDAFFDHSSDEELAAAYERGLRLLDGTAGARLSQAVTELENRGELPQGSVEHSELGWRASRSVDRVIRYAYAEAMRLANAKSPRQRIETLWLTGASQEFEIHVCEGRRHVTVVMFIPETRQYGSNRAEARSWVVRAANERDRADTRVLDEESPPVVMTQVSGRQRDPAPE